MQIGGELTISQGGETFLYNNKTPERIRKQLYLSGEAIVQTARLRYVPVETSALISTLRIEKRSSDEFVLVSGNYNMEQGGTRYEYKNSKVKGNTDKYEWWDRAFSDRRDRIQRDLREILKKGNQ